MTDARQLSEIAENEVDNPEDDFANCAANLEFGRLSSRFEPPPPRRAWWKSYSTPFLHPIVDCECGAFMSRGALYLKAGRAMVVAMSAKSSQKSKSLGNIWREAPSQFSLFQFSLRACAISHPMISASCLFEPPRPERPSCPATISVLSNNSFISALFTRSRATHLAGST